MELVLYKKIREGYDIRLAKFKKQINMVSDNEKISSDDYSLTDLVELVKDMKVTGENIVKK